MKKKLEADLSSIAHRIFKLKNKSDINQLYLETQKLYEKLAVLKFVDDNFDEVKPTISHSEISYEIETIFEKQEETPILTEEILIEETFEPQIEEEILSETEQEEITESTLSQESSTIEDFIEEKVAEPIFEEKKESEVIEELSFSTVNETNPISDFKPAFELEEVTEEKIIEEEVSNQSKPVQISFEDII